VAGVHDLTLADVCHEHARSRGSRFALVCGDVRLTYRELADRSDHLAAALAGAGVGAGDRVLWLGQNCHRVVEGLVACAKLGAVLCPANWRQSTEELLTLLADSRPGVIIWQREEIGDVVAAARERWSGGGRWVLHDADPGDPEGYEAFVDAGRPGPGGDVAPSDPVLMLYTGAFGGTPNGSLLSHRAVVAQGAMIAMVQRITEGTVYLNSGPMFHMATLMTTFATLVMGGTNVMTRRVDAEELCRIIEAERCNYGFVMGPTAVEILEVNKEGRYDLSSFRTFGAGKRWNAMVTVDDSPWGTSPAGYGQTEVTGMLTFNCMGVGTTGTSGRPSPLVEMLIVDPDGAAVPDTETGEIVARGVTIHNGYHDRAELNAERFRGGWWHTGDLGRREADGSLTY
jgi:long-chain acyl-CoA synthetase